MPHGQERNAQPRAKEQDEVQSQLVPATIPGLLFSKSEHLLNLSVPGCFDFFFKYQGGVDLPPYVKFSEPPLN